jgi:hypothetical protein
MPMKTESPVVPAGQVPMGGWSAASTGPTAPGSATLPAAAAPMRMTSRRLRPDGFLDEVFIAVSFAVVKVFAQTYLSQIDLPQI